MDAQPKVVMIFRQPGMVLSVSRSNLDEVRAYIARQRSTIVKYHFVTNTWRS
jgi:hypothetical protein